MIKSLPSQKRRRSEEMDLLENPLRLIDSYFLWDPLRCGKLPAIGGVRWDFWGLAFWPFFFCWDSKRSNVRKSQRAPERFLRTGLCRSSMPCMMNRTYWRSGEDDWMEAVVFFWGQKKILWSFFLVDGKWEVTHPCCMLCSCCWSVTGEGWRGLDTIEDDSSFWKGQLVMVFCWLGRIIDGCFQRIHVFLWESQFINSLSGALKMLFCVLLDLVKFHSWSFPCDFDCFMMRL